MELKVLELSHLIYWLKKNFGYFKLSVSKTFKICNLQKEWFCFRYHHWRWILLLFVIIMYTWQEKILSILDLIFSLLEVSTGTELCMGIGMVFILFLVEKLLFNLHCLSFCMSVCTTLSVILMCWKKNAIFSAHNLAKR